VSGALIQLKSTRTLVRASAGSGKTYTLTIEYLARLLLGEDPGAILATTFTKAAAGEIRGRVLERLADAAVDEEALERLSGEVRGVLEGASRVTIDRARMEAMLRELVDQAPRLSIMTIDSFVSRLASAYGFELGLAPGWRMIDEEEDAVLVDDAIANAIDEAPVEEVVELLRDLHKGRTGSGVHRALVDAVRSGHAAYVSTIDRPEAWEAIGVVGTPMRAETLGWLAESLRAWEIPTNKDGSESKPWRKAFESLAAMIDDGDWAGMLSSGLLVKAAEARISGETPTYSKKVFDDGLVEALSPLLDHAAHELSAAHLARTVALRSLLARFDGVYTREKIRRGTLTFSDPTRMLMQAKVMDDLEHLYFRIDGALRHVMLDEFQDTSMSQFALLEPILDEMLSQLDDSRSTIIVGDVKQSLYAWRDAEPMLMHGLDRRWTLEEKPLTKSWRSAQTVLDCVDGVFSGITGNAALLGDDDAGLDAAALWAGYPEHESARDEMVGLATLRVVERDEDQKEHDALLDGCADRVRALAELDDGRTIAVLVRSGKHIAPMIARLSAMGIHASEERGNPLVDTPIVAAVVSALTLATDPGNSAARRFVATTPLGALLGIALGGEDRGAAAGALIRRRCADDGIARVVIGWIPELAGSTDERGLARLGQLAALADTLAREGRGSIRELLREVETKRVQEPGRGGVRVMTIHKSKGLEFDSVVIPLHSKAWQLESKNVLTRREHPLGEIDAVTRYPDATMRLVHPGLRAIHGSALAIALNEELCCLYVAMTRARSTLDLLIAPVEPDSKGNVKLRRNARDVVRTALAPEDECQEPGIVWSDGEDVAIAHGVEQDHERPRVRLRVEDRGSRAYEIEAPSVADRVSGASLLGLDPDRRRAISMGELIHKGFELVEWIEDVDGLDECMIAGHIGDDSERAMIAARVVARALGSEPVRRVLSREWFARSHGNLDEAHALREHPFAARTPDGRFVGGRFDRIVLGVCDGRVIGCEIVDFKSDSVPEGWDQSTLDAMAAAHAAQMRSYRDAAAAMYGLDPDSIACTIVFTGAPGCAPVAL
jgi:ATP-dependent exoDNAse (exonuclease V) beta subunit